MAQFEEIQQRLRRPIGMWNCKHTRHPIILGVSEPTYSPEQLEKLRRNSSAQITIDGVTKSRYEWTQEQRRIETAIRYQDDVVTMASAIGDNTAVSEARGNIKRLIGQYDHISESAGLETRYERTVGYGAAQLEVFHHRVGYKTLTCFDLDANMLVEVSDEVRHVVDETSKLIVDDMPELDLYLSQVAFGDVGKGNPAELSFSLQNGYPGMVLALNADMWKDVDIIQRLVDAESAAGRHVYSGDVHSVIAHEYGHVAVFSSILRTLGYTGKGRLFSGVAAELLFNNQKDLLEQQVRKIKNRCADVVLSQRAQDSIEEYIAEAFSDYYYGSRQKVSVMIVNYMKGVLKNGIL